jgi:ATP-dependent DNA helicase UvrD/PcrA
MFFSQHNEKQLEAIQHVEGPMLVLAGAGSGKTRVVAHRICNLIDLGILPSDIIAVTFTNKAANEMSFRIKKMKDASVLACTFHSLGARILRESITSIGYKRDFTIYDEEDSHKVLKNCLKTLEIKEEKGLIKSIKARISAAKNDLLSQDDIKPNNNGTKADRLFPKIFPIYQSQLKNSNALDFDDLLYLTANLIREDHSIKNLYQNRWLFILIDEYQDTNYAQYMITKILAEKHGNIFAVGDPDQSIYSWRGARYQNILRFDKDFPGSKIITLEENYRSTQNILNAANALIQKNENRYEKDLWSNLGEGEKIKVYFAQNERMEASFVAKKIAEYVVSIQASLNDFVIFYRTNSQSRVIEDILLEKQIPYKIIGSVSFYQRKEIKDVLSILKMIASNSDIVAFSRSFLLTIKGIGQTTLNKIILKAQQTQVPIFQISENLTHDSDLIRLNIKQKKGLEKYVQTIKNLRLSQHTLTDLIKTAIEEFHYLTILKEDPDTFLDRKQNIDELISKAAEWEMQNDSRSLHLFLEDLTLMNNQETHTNDETIQLMTVHNGKGLEFKIVFLIGLEEDLFPHANSKDNLEALEEERRLAYVAMTRSKQILFLCGAHYRYIWGSARIMQPSRFLKEIPTKFLENLSPTSFEEQDSYFEKTSEFTKGDFVIHKEFGRGQIQKVYTTSYGETYDIFFQDLKGTRSMVAKFAKLKKN